MTFQRELEECLYWMGMLTRRDYPEPNWQVNRQAILGVLPRSSATWARCINFRAERLRSLDAPAYGLLVNTRSCPIESSLKDYALKRTELVGDCRLLRIAVGCPMSLIVYSRFGKVGEALHDTV